MYNFKYKSTDVAIMLTHLYTLWCQVHNKDRLTCIDSWCSVALLGWRDNIEVWGHQLGWAAEYLPRLFRRLWRHEAEVNLCRLSLCVSSLKLISYYCLLFLHCSLTRKFFPDVLFDILLLRFWSSIQIYEK